MSAMPVSLPSLTCSASFSIQPALLSWYGSSVITTAPRLWRPLPGWISSMWATPRMGMLPRP